MKLSDFFPELEGWTDVTDRVLAERAAAAKPTIPDPNSVVSPFLRAPLPLPLQYPQDTLKQFNRPGLSSFRLSPVSPAALPANNSAAQNIAMIVAKQVAASTPSSSGTDIDIITAINRQVFGSVDASYQTTNVSVPGTINSISTTGVASSLNTVALAVADGNANVGGSPGAGWTSLGGGGEYWKIVPQGSLTITQSFGAGQNTACQALCLFRGNGTAPTFTNRGSGTGGASPKTISFAPGAAGNSLLFINVGGGQFNNNISVSDNQGNNWQILQNAFAIDGPVGSSPANQINIAYAQNISGSNTTVTVTFNSNNSLGNWILYEVTNLLNVSSGAYTFQNSDNDKMVLFTGGANIAATLPSPALPAGWQALVVNDSGVGIDTLIPQSGALLNNVNANQILQPGYFTWIFSDGTNYWLTNKIQPQAISKLAHQWLDSYNVQTGLFTQSQPAFSDISGNIATGQMAGGVGADSSHFWRGDGTWAKIDWNNLAGAQSNLATAYNGVTLVGNGIPSIVGAVDSMTNTANIALTNIFTPGNNAIYATPYRITYFVIVNRAATTSSTLPDLQFTWVDNDGGATWTFGPVDATSPGGNSTLTGYSGSFIAMVKPNNALKYQTGVSTLYASSGATSMQYSVHIRLEAL